MSILPHPPQPGLKSLAVLGSTGSIGTQTLDVAARFPERFQVVALAAGDNLERLAGQVNQFQPSWVVIKDPRRLSDFRALVPGYQGHVLAGASGLEEVATLEGVDTVVVGLVGMIGLAPTLSALKTGKQVCTANKETFVAGGHLVAPYLPQLVPMDSEHSAIFQCLKGEPEKAFETIYLTASGGPFRQLSKAQLEQVTRQQALQHPNWVMGPKVTIDSATMMNKGLEVIEAHWLFGATYDQIEVVVHPQSVIHSAVAFVDGSVMAQLGAPDMHVPIQVALSHPERLAAVYDTNGQSSRLDLLALSKLELEPPDLDRFPCIGLAYQAGRLGSSATAVLNAADEVAVELFLREKIGYAHIARLLAQTLEQHQADGIVAEPGLEHIVALDAWARRFVDEQAASLI